MLDGTSRAWVIMNYTLLTLSFFLRVCHYRLENISKRSFAGVGPQEPYEAGRIRALAPPPCQGVYGGVSEGFRASTYIRALPSLFERTHTE